MPPPPPKVVVVGSLNMDYIATVMRLPAPGETVSASNLIRRFGGKGANQAIAAARHGARVSMVGCVGADDEGRAYRRRLRDEGIETTGLSTTDKALTGTALIAVDHSAENLIIVAPGANGHLTAAATRAQRSRITSADILLLQFEVPMSAILEAVRLANRAGVPVVVNPSPMRAGFAWGKCRVDTLIVNAGEAQAIFGLQIARLGARLAVWRGALARKRIARLLITRGSRPTICLTEKEYFEVATVPVKPIDTVGAGDAFAGALVTRLAEGTDLAAAVRCANCAGALATLRPGAQEAIPTRATIDLHLSP
jgi:ribokinase